MDDSSRRLSALTLQPPASPTNRRALVFWASAFCLFSEPSQAEPGTGSGSLDRVTAEVLFDRGKEQLVAENYEEACPLLEESYRLVPGIGVLLHLAMCLENSNQLAAAWAAFREAADRARVDGDAERETLARFRAEQLYAKLSFLTLKLRTDSGEMTTSRMYPAGLRILRDGKTVSPTTLGIELPIDPGPHTILVTADAMNATTSTTTLLAGEHTTVEVALVPQPVSPRPPPLLSHPAPAITIRAPAKSTPNQPQRPKNDPIPHRDWLPWTAAGIGSLGLVVGATSGILAANKMKDARERCAGHPTNDCPTSAIQLQETARSYASISTSALAVGLAGWVVAGGYWFVTDSKRTAISGWMSPNAGALTMYSRW